ncbi:beta-microseminoprotein-like [Engystomops pustulosus]|uniref:beta-microseminoprotein-like n=1 Tax=Engystomops pustulosus TaxID=76066 RepID=UPI003AFB4878
MRFLVAVAYGAGIFVFFCDADCYRSNVKLKKGETPTGCFYKDTMYPLNSKWRKNCTDCTCFSNGNYECCLAYLTPGEYDKEKCKFVFDDKKCEYVLIPNEDPTKKCEDYTKYE